MLAEDNDETIISPFRVSLLTFKRFLAQQMAIVEGPSSARMLPEHCQDGARALPGHPHPHLMVAS